jgi:hypothetical protein
VRRSENRSVLVDLSEGTPGGRKGKEKESVRERKILGLIGLSGRMSV